MAGERQLAKWLLGMIDSSEVWHCVRPMHSGLTADEIALSASGVFSFDRCMKITKCLRKALAAAPDSWIYDGRTRDRRRLADWWDDHNEQKQEVEYGYA